MVTKTKPAQFAVSTQDVDGRGRRTFRSFDGAEKYFKSMCGLTLAQVIDEVYFHGFKPTVDQVTAICGVSSFGTRVVFQRIGDAFAPAFDAREVAMEAWRAAGKPNMGDPINVTPVAPPMDGWALVQCDLNSSELGDVLGTYPSEHAALEAGNDLSDTTKARGLYVAKRKADGQWERRLEARDRNEREDDAYLEAHYAELDAERANEFPAGEFPF